jgi:hypothetical protein
LSFWTCLSTGLWDCTKPPGLIVGQASGVCQL